MSYIFIILKIKKYIICLYIKSKYILQLPKFYKFPLMAEDLMNVEITEYIKQKIGKWRSETPLMTKLFVYLNLISCFLSTLWIFGVHIQFFVINSPGLTLRKFQGF